MYEHVYVCIGKYMTTLCDRVVNSYYNRYVYIHHDYYIIKVSSKKNL